MNGPGGVRDVEQKAWFKQLARGRVSVFFWVFAIVAIANVIGEENDIFLHVLDDYVDLVIAAVGIILLYTMWKKKSTQSLRRANDIVAVLAVGLILMTLFAVAQEIGDPTDFGNEIPTLLFGVFLLINRFV